MGCGKSKLQDVAIGKSLSKSRTAKFTKTSLSDNNKTTPPSNSSPTVNAAPVEAAAAAATVVYDSIPEESPVQAANSVVSDTAKPEESPMFTLISDKTVEESPVETSHQVTEESPAETSQQVTEESPVYTVVSDTNSEDSPAYTLVSDTKPEEESLVSDTKPEETFLMSNWVDDAMDIVPKTETETEDVNIINSDNNESSPVQDLIMTSEPTPKESRIAATAAAAGDHEDEVVKEGETATEFDDTQTTILPIHEKENNIVKADEKEPTEENGMKSEDSFDKEHHKEIKEKTVIIAEEAN